MTMISKTIYIAGPMRGYPRYNFDAFHQAEQQLKQQGWNPLSPARADEDRGFNPNQDHIFTQNDMVDFIRRDIDLICKSDALALLPGWERSVGATAEVAVARWKGIPVYRYPSMQAIDTWPTVEESVEGTGPSRLYSRG